MIHINLLPGANKKTTSRQGVDLSAFRASFSGMFRDRFLIGAASAVVLSLGAVGYLYFTQTKKTAELEARRDLSVSDSTRYANFLKDRWHAEAVRDTLLRQVNLIKNLDEDRFVWSHVMDEVSRALPQYTWLTTISFTGTPQAIDQRRGVARREGRYVGGREEEGGRQGRRSGSTRTSRAIRSAFASPATRWTSRR